MSPDTTPSRTRPSLTTPSGGESPRRRLTGDQTVPTERTDRLDKFKVDVAILGELSLDEGKDIEGIDAIARLFLQDFQTANPATQQELAKKLRKNINNKLHGRLNSSLSLLHDLQREVGIDIQAVGIEQRTWRELYDNSPSSDRLQIVRTVKTETEEWFIKNFEVYLAEWREALAANAAISPQVAEKQITAQRKAFENASRWGQIGLSRQLREKVEASSSGEFSTLLGLYKELLAINGSYMSPKELPDPEEIIAEYNAGNSRPRVVHDLHSRVSMLITAVPPEKPKKSTK